MNSSSSSSSSSSSTSAVIKVKYGDILRRFEAEVVEDALVLTLDELKRKIVSLFSLSSDAVLILTYVDEDDDVVHLVDADDMHDMAKQNLDPIRITVRLKREPNVTRKPSRSHHELHQLQDLGAGIAQVQDKLRDLRIGVAGKLEKSSCYMTSRTLGRIVELVTAFPISGQQPVHDLQTEVARLLKTCLSDLKSRGVGSSEHVAELVDTIAKVVRSLGQTSATPTGDDQPNKNNEPNNSSSKTNNNRESDISMVNADKLKVSSNGIQGQALENNGGSMKVQPKVDKEDVLEVTDASGKSRPVSKLCNHSKRSGGSQPGPKITPDPITSSSPNLYQFPGTSKVPTILSTYHNALCSFGKITDQSSSAGPPSLHYGVCCNGCGIHPITGPRFKSTVKLDYDLCCSCFQEMGNIRDYIRMDCPTVYHDIPSAKGILHYALTEPRTSSIKKSRSKSRQPKLHCSFIQDVNVLDGTVIAPLTPFTKIWRVRNSGEVEWPHKTTLAFVGGNLLRNQYNVELEIPLAGIPVSQEMDIAVDFLAPERPGVYASYWRMISPNGKLFGQRIWVFIEVRASEEKTPSESVTIGFNLNLPPENGQPGRNPEPVPSVEDSPPRPESIEKIDDQLVEPVVSMQPDYSQEMKFPINDTLLVGKSTLIPIPAVEDNATLPMPEPFSTTESDIGASSSAPSPTVDTVAPESKIELLEEKLVKELEQVAFEEVDSNDEVLVVEGSDYLVDLVSDSNSDSDWDPILYELREMGFENIETNKKLLEKNKGSITRVVMDLIAEENPSLVIL